MSLANSCGLVMAVIFCFYLYDVTDAHSYHLGSCPVVEPMNNFKMDRLLGKWYVIQKTSTGSRCLTYNFTETSEPHQYKVEQVSEHPVLGLASVDNKYHYTGVINVPHKDVPAKMVVQFPLSVAGTASYTVFDTDYDSYAGIFTCQKLAFANRQSATLLSRTKTMSANQLEQLRSKLSHFGVDPFELSIIDQAKCEAPDAVNISIDDDTFSPSNIGAVVRKAGEKVGDGVEFAAEGAKKLYNTLKSNKDKAAEEMDRR
nr:apolipoprotein D-like protein 9 [Nilaparvata lugens]